MSGNKTRTAAIAATSVVAAMVTALGAATPAQAIPPVGPNQSITYTYYADTAKTTVVGGWSYGSCGEPFDWGTHTRYFTIDRTTCTID